MYFRFIWKEVLVSDRCMLLILLELLLDLDGLRDIETVNKEFRSYCGVIL